MLERTKRKGQSTTLTSLYTIHCSHSYSSDVSTVLLVNEPILKETNTYVLICILDMNNFGHPKKKVGGSLDMEVDEEVYILRPTPLVFSM